MHMDDFLRFSKSLIFHENMKNYVHKINLGSLGKYLGVIKYHLEQFLIALDDLR